MQIMDMNEVEIIEDARVEYCGPNDANGEVGRVDHITSTGDTYVEMLSGYGLTGETYCLPARYLAVLSDDQVAVHFGHLDPSYLLVAALHRTVSVKAKTDMRRRLNATVGVSR